MQTVEQFQSSIKDKPWFDSIETVNNKVVVYIHKMDKETLSLPDIVDDKQVLVHFAGSKSVDKSKYVSDVKLYSMPISTDPSIEEELEVLCVMCNNNLAILQDIFLETHDGVENALTDFSSKYPKVRAKMESLYHKFGYDILYENLDLGYEEKI
jgi:hypothetical protein